MFAFIAPVTYLHSRLRAIAIIAGLLTLLSACSPSIAPYSERAYTQAVDLKVESLKLMDVAESPFESHKTRIEKLQLSLDKASEFSKGRPRNEYSAKQWELLLSSDRNLLGGFLSRWEQSKTLSWPFIAESKGVIAKAFDTIIGLESGKIKAGE